MIKMRLYILLFFALFLTKAAFAQPEVETIPPYNIKSVAFMQNDQIIQPFIRLGDPFNFVFDDLYGDEANYYYTITHCDYDWKKSQLPINDYLLGLDDQRIIDYENSFNTLQLYSHYRLRFPNQFTRGFKVSGNYIIKIFNDSRELVFSRRFVLFEDLVAVPLQIKNPRDVNVLHQKHNLDFSIRPNNFLLQDPVKNVRVVLLQNGIWHTAINNIKPMFTVGSDLIYRYDAETQFWAGNEFLFFDNKDIRNAVNNIRRVETKGGIYNSYLFTNASRANDPYTFFPDANGMFVVRNLFAQQNSNVEADYAWVFFTLDAPTVAANKNVYITGMFNNYALTDEFKMEYNAKRNVFEKALILKQGFVNYMYTITDTRGKIDAQNAVDGNFFQTENDYMVLVYYRPNNERFDRVIGRGTANSENISN
jgi:hypothetical protein